MAALALEGADPAARREQGGEMATGGQAGHADCLGVNAVGRGLGPQPTHGGLGVVNGGGKRGLAREPVGNRDDDETARG